MRRVDRISAGLLFLLAIAHGFTAGRAVNGRLWYFSAGLALLFASMLNLLRIRNGYSVHSLKLFCIAANVIMTAFMISLIASIGVPRTLQNPMIPALLILLMIETSFSLAKNT
jgi:hypothetical protein